jgi:O-antigen/teichoic acid export membrane protein
MLGIPIQIMFILFMSIAVGRRLFKDIVVATILNDGFFLIMLVFMAATSSITTRATFAVWSVVTLAANIYLMIRILRVSPVRSFRWRVFLVDFRYTMWRYSYSIINTLYSRADTYLVAQFLTPAHIGWYAMANSMGEALLNLPKALNLVVLSHTASDRLDQRRGRAAYRTVAIMLGGACLVLIAVAGYLIPALFTPAFSASVLPLRVLLIGVFWQGLAGMAVHQLYGLNDPVLPVVSSTIAFGVVVIAGFLLIPQLGLFGAALSAVLGKTVFMTVVFFRLNQQTGIGFASIFSYSSTDFQSLMKRLHSLRS